MVYVQKIARPRNQWGLFGTLIWSAVVAVIVIVMQGVGLALFVAAPHHTKPGQSEYFREIQAAANNGTAVSLITLATAVISVSLLVGIIKLKKDSALGTYFCLNVVPAKTMFVWFAMTAGLILFSDLLTASLGRSIVPEFVHATYVTARPVWLLWVAFVVVAPIAEELFYRGFLFAGIQSSFMKPVGAIFFHCGFMGGHACSI